MWFRQQSEEACLRSGFQPRIAIETTVGGLLTLGRTSYGVGVLSGDNLMRSDDAPHPRLVDSAGNFLESTVWAHWRTTSPAIDMFVEFLKDFVSTLE